VGHAATVEGTRTRKLLAILLLNANGFQTYDRIAEGLWDDPPTTARAQIFTAASALRKLLASVGARAVLMTADGGYRLDLRDDRVDLALFQEKCEAAEEAAAEGAVDRAIALLREALTLWRGSPLSGLTDARDLADGAARLAEVRAKAIERIALLRLRHGESASLIADLTEFVAEFPYRDPLRAALMAALYNAGRRADALALYDRARRMLAEEVGVDPSPRLRELHRVVLEGEIAVIDEQGKPLEPTVSAAAADTPPGAPGRCYLPRTLRDFSGRSAEVEQLLSAVDDNASAALIVSPIDGMGGVGKTTLAVHVAHQLADRYPDGQFFIDLHGFSDGLFPLTPGQGLDALLQEAGVAPELVPSDLDQRSAVWRSTMADRRALILLDNVTDVAQVRPLLPGTSQTLVIITSRRRLTSLEGAVPLSLDVLTVDGAVELFTKIVGAARLFGQEEAVSRAVELCGRLPLAVSIAAARLRDRASWTVRYLVEQLTSQRLRRRILSAGDRNVMAVLSLSYRYLDEDTQRVLRLLSLHPGDDFDCYSAAAIADLPVDDAAESLERLYEDNLLLQRAPGRYRFHDLIRDCAHDLLERVDSAEARQTARRRLFDYYLRAAHTWCQPMAKGPFRFDLDARTAAVETPPSHSHLEALNHLRAEYRTVTALFRLAREDGRHDHAWQLVCAAQPLIKELNYGGDALEMFEGALASARSVGNRRAESACLTGIGLVRRERALNAQAALALEEAIAISRAIGDKACEAHQLADLGAVRLNDLRTADAYGLFFRGRGLAEEVGDEVALAALENNLGLVCDELGRPDEAIHYFDRAMAYYGKSGDDRSVALTQINIGVLLCRTGDYTGAVDRLEKGLELSRVHGIVRALGWALSALCVAFRANGNIERALECGRESLAVAREAKIIDVECEALAGLAETYLAANDLDSADRVYQNVEHVATEHGLSLPAARAREGYAHIAAGKGDEVLAQEHWVEAVALYPADAADASHARLHLAEMDEPATINCLRCAR
jgi:DNA-binding SARP family transcriptional activator